MLLFSLRLWMHNPQKPLWPQWCLAHAFENLGTFIKEWELHSARLEFMSIAREWLPTSSAGRWRTGINKAHPPICTIRLVYLSNVCVLVHGKSLQLCLALWDPTDCSSSGHTDCPWNSPGMNTWVGCHVFLYGIFPTQGSNLCLFHLLHWQAGSLPLAPPGRTNQLQKYILKLFFQGPDLYKLFYQAWNQ